MNKLDINLEFVLNKFQKEDYVSVISNFDVAENLVEELEELGFLFDEDNFNVLASERYTTFIISKCKNELFIESFYNSKGEPLHHEGDFVYIQHGLLNDEELEHISADIERGFLLVYNF